MRLSDSPGSRGPRRRTASTTDRARTTHTARRPCHQRRIGTSARSGCVRSGTGRTAILRAALPVASCRTRRRAALRPGNGASVRTTSGPAPQRIVLRVRCDSRRLSTRRRPVSSASLRHHRLGEPDWVYVLGPI